MLKTLKNAWRIPELRSKLLFTLLIIVLYRLGANIPVPYVDPEVFESASAVGTVGLSMGLTPALSTVSKIILILSMYTGRVGGLTLVFAAITRRSIDNRHYPADNIAVG
jgi:Trk-type K+ transport system membrane component